MDKVGVMPNSLNSAVDEISREITRAAEAEKEKQALTYWSVTKSCLNCTKNLKCNLPRFVRNSRCKVFEPSQQHLREIAQHNSEVKRKRSQSR